MAACQLAWSRISSIGWRIFQGGFKVYYSSSMLRDTDVVTEVISGVGSLQDVGPSLDRLNIIVSPMLVSSVIESCGVNKECNSRRLLRFLSWCRSKDDLLFGQAFNQAIRTFAKMGDFTAMGILIEDSRKEGKSMDPETFAVVVDTLVRAGKEDEAVRWFRLLKSQRMLPYPFIDKEGEDQWSSSLALVQALCSKGHASLAERIVSRHKGELLVKPTAIVVHRWLLHGWCTCGNLKEARRVKGEMKSAGIPLILPSWHDLLRCVCHRNLKSNPSALVSEANELLTEMVTLGVSPVAASYNILLSCLGKARRVKEAYRILCLMREGKALCSPDCVSYYLVVRVLYLTKRFVKGNCVVGQMLNDGVIPGAKFSKPLIGILIGLDQIHHAHELFNTMKKWCQSVDGPTYNLLITKLCKSGNFDAGRALWDEAVERGVTVECISCLLDPPKNEIFALKKSIVEEGH